MPVEPRDADWQGEQGCLSVIIAREGLVRARPGLPEDPRRPPAATAEAGAAEGEDDLHRAEGWGVERTTESLYFRFLRLNSPGRGGGGGDCFCILSLNWLC